MTLGSQSKPARGAWQTGLPNKQCKHCQPLQEPCMVKGGGGGGGCVQGVCTGCLSSRACRSDLLVQAAAIPASMSHCRLAATAFEPECPAGPIWQSGPQCVIITGQPLPCGYLKVNIVVLLSCHASSVLDKLSPHFVGRRYDYPVSTIPAAGWASLPMS